MSQTQSDTVHNGNTKLHCARSRAWSITVFNYKDTLDNLKDLIKRECKDGGFQEEIAPSTGREHLQGYLYFDNPRTFDQIILKLKDYGFLDVHIEKAKNPQKLKEYCKKVETRKPGGVLFLSHPPKISPLEGKVLYPFQEEICNLIKEKPDDRTIHWYWEPKGKTGKTTLIRHINRTRPGELLLCSGKAVDAKCEVAEYIENTGIEPKIIIFHFVRSVEQFVTYQGIEELKDGIFSSSKYRGGMIDIEPPHVIIFANFPPDMNKLSEDRWRIIKI